MRNNQVAVWATMLAMLSLAGCKRGPKQTDAAEAPPPSPPVVETGTSGPVRVDKPSAYSLVAATTQQAVSRLSVTGTVSPDVSRELPVLSLANGRVVALHVGLGDYVRKGQLVMEVQSPDVSTAFDTYLKAVNDEHLADVTLKRDELLYAKGAIAQTQLEGAQDGEQDAVADLTASRQQLRILGVDPKAPGDTVKVYAPASGVIISQNVTAAGAAGIGFAGPGGSLTIADLSHIWVICDVYENDLQDVHLGQRAQIQIAAYPGKVFTGTVSDIGAVLDPNIRTAKVRIQVQNPGDELRIGMFATATLLGMRPQVDVVVPSTAVLNLHDRTYVFVPQGNGFIRQTVKAGGQGTGDTTVIAAGLSAGQRVVANALNLEETADQQ